MFAHVRFVLLVCHGDLAHCVKDIVAEVTCHLHQPPHTPSVVVRGGTLEHARSQSGMIRRNLTHSLTPSPLLPHPPLDDTAIHSLISLHHHYSPHLSTTTPPPPLTSQQHHHHHLHSPLNTTTPTPLSTTSPLAHITTHATFITAVVLITVLLITTYLT